RTGGALHSCDQGGVMLVEPNTGRLVLRTLVEGRRNGAAAELEAGQALAGWVLANQIAANVADVTADRRWQAHGATDGAARSALAVPVSLERETLGVLLLLSTRTAHFSNGHAQLAQAAAGQAAVALSKAQLHRYVSEQSERLGALAQQREEEASKLLAILHSIGDGVVMSDRLGRIRIVNPAAAHILGINHNDFVGRALDDLPGVSTTIDEESAAVPSKFAVGERTVSAHAARVVSGRDEWLGSVVVYHDITREELADRLKSELVATASHELRTPMTSIRGYIDMLLLGTFGDISASQRDALKVIKNNVTRLVHLIDEILDMSSVESGEVRLHRAPVDAAEVLRDVTRELYSQFLERNVALTLEVQEELPPVYADRQRLQQIVVNLVGNACKYTPRAARFLWRSITAVARSVSMYRIPEWVSPRLRASIFLRPSTAPTIRCATKWAALALGCISRVSLWSCTAGASGSRASSARAALLASRCRSHRRVEALYARVIVNH
ncbi:GAF domain-containing protein, partial [Candidatus Gracilibacteria bacterium]|nr:GAF domain-containing protein [Candidatus Gracilibacteria bacterium]